MSSKEQDTKKAQEVTPAPPTGNLFAFDEFDNFFEDFLSRKWPRLLDWNLPTGFDKSFPKIDILDHENDIEVQAALPGIKKEDLRVTINNQTITIRTSSKEEKNEEKGKYFRREITRGEFQRTVSLPDNVDDANAKASFKDGILTVSIPKTEKSKRKTKTIEIK